MEIILLIIVLLIAITASFSDGSALTDEIISLFYTDNIVMVSKSEIKEQSSTSESVQRKVNNINKTTKNNKNNIIGTEDGIISSSVSVNTINTIINDSDNLGDNPHSYYKYE